MNKTICLLAIGLGLAIQSCNDPAATNSENTNQDTAMKTSANKSFQESIDGLNTDLYTLKNKNNFTVTLTNYGARLVSVLVPDSAGKETDVILGHEGVAGYHKAKEPFFGCTIGRYGNRIGKGKFTLEGKEYSIDLNDGPNTLHGGSKGFNAKVWTANQLSDTSIEFTLASPDGDMGYPGNLNAKVTYTITDDNALKIEYDASTDKTTVVNLTNHAYFNLNGAGSGTINDHLLMIDADNITPVDSTLIPTGKLQPVTGGAFDFRKPTPIGQKIENDDVQLKNGKGYDHNFALNGKAGVVRLVATVLGPKTGIFMEVLTDQPGIQLYGGNFLDGTEKGKGGKAYDFRTAFCLETQHFPDAPNKPNFASTTLKPGEKYMHTTIYRFSTKNN
ncbi:MAG: galactose mutarotase [Gemmatimonadaceae bacterium]|nr:galactose mutarotase [Chitinophagaceae bacterium]